MKITSFLAGCISSASLIFILGSSPSDQMNPRSEFTQREDNSRLRCQEYDDDKTYLTCVGAKSAKELTAIIKRIEQKLPNFKEF